MSDVNLERVADKIKKLLALGTSSNENEAMASLEKARKLAFEYNLSMDEITLEKSSIEESPYFSGKKWNGWKVKLLQAVAVSNLGKLIIHTQMYGTKVSKKDFTLVGKPHNITMIKTMADYLFDTIKRMANDQGFKNRLYTESYMVGVAHTICNRLFEMKKQDVQEAGINALVVREDGEINDYLNQFKMKTHPIKSAEIKSQGAYLQGVIDGKNVGLAQQLQKTYGNQVAMLN